MYRPEHENGLRMMPGMLYGRMLVIGLGKGEILASFLRFPSLHRIVVVDNDPEVIAAFEIRDPRIQVVEADAADYYKNNHGFFDFICQDLPNPLPGGPWLKNPTGSSTWVSV